MIKEAILEQLLIAGADINAPSVNRYNRSKIQTPIKHCLTNGKVGEPITDKLIEMLLNHGAKAKHIGKK